MSVSIAAVTLGSSDSGPSNGSTRLLRVRTYAALAEVAAVGKRSAKAIPGSTYVRDGQVIVSKR
jgi:hypothetical protein